MRALLLALVVGALGCGGDNRVAHDAGSDPHDGGTPDAGSDAGASPFAYCLDRPDSIVPPPPTHGLPCELAPPSLTH